jgi:hypothetical protein
MNMTGLINTRLFMKTGDFSRNVYFINWQSAESFIQMISEEYGTYTKLGKSGSVGAF